MKMILTELYAINEDILAGMTLCLSLSLSFSLTLSLTLSLSFLLPLFLPGEYSSSGHIDELDIGVPCTDLVLASSSSSSSSSSSERGPYADVLQDFMIRSYMSGGRKTKPTVNMSM